MVATTCGDGTVLQGSTCVPVTGGSAGAPTISKIDPPNAGIAGLSLFTITGTGFAGDNVSSLTVYFGNTANTACAATVGTATATTIAGEVPPACSLSTSVTVTVTTSIGSATTPFSYEALFAADGDADSDGGTTNELYVIDPHAGLSFDLGALATAGGGSAYGFSGLAFSTSGTLYGVTTGDSAADTAKLAQLVTIDLATGAVTALGTLKDAAGTAYTVSDMKFSGSTLYAFGYATVSNASTQGLITIDTTTGAVTAVGTPAAATDGYAGLAFDANGIAYVAANAAGSNFLIGESGALDTLNMSTGSPTSVATLDWPVAAPIHSMAYVGTTLFALVDDGLYGKATLQPLFGEELVVIDRTHNPIVYPAFEAPAKLGAESHASTLATAPALTIARTLPREGWTQLAAGSAPAAPAN